MVQIWYLLHISDWFDEKTAIAVSAAVFSCLQNMLTLSAARTRCILSKQYQNVMFEFSVNEEIDSISKNEEKRRSKSKSSNASLVLRPRGRSGQVAEENPLERDLLNSQNRDE